jgi:hypothetical protein
MADVNQTVSDLQKGLEEIEKSISNLSFSDLGKGVSKVQESLTLSVNSVKKLNEQFKLGKDISSSLQTQSLKFQAKNEVLLLKEKNIRDEITALLKRNANANTDSYELRLQQVRAERQISEQIDFQLRQIEKGNEERKKQNNITEVLGKKIKEIIEPFKQITTIAGLFKIFLDSALRFNKISVEIGKNLGYGADNANRVTTNLKNIAQNASSVNVTLANAAEAMNQLSEATGYVAEYSADALETQIMLTKQFGLTAEEAAGIYKFSVLTGKSSKAVNDAMVGAFVATRNQLKVGVPFKVAIAEAAKLSGRLAANFQNNPETIVKAVVATKALGTSLEQTAKQGESLLNFESSIESELKAELITGKQLNLEKARAAALTGDQVTLAEELNSQVGSLEEFQQMNVIQQKAIAEAVGLTSDELADQLRKQQIAQEQGKSLAQITKEEALAAEQRQATQDKFNQSILKLQDFFGNLLAGPLGQFLEFLSKSLDYVTAIGAGLVTWQIASKAVAFYEGVIAIQKSAQKGYGNALIAQARTSLGLSTAKAATDTVSATALSFGALLPVILGAAVTAYSLFSSFKADDLMSEGGYGKRTLLAPEGAFKLNDNDTIIAGTDLDGGAGGGGPIDLTPMISAINEVRAAVDRLYNKDQSINMDGKKVGTTLVQNTYKLA